MEGAWERGGERVKNCRGGHGGTQATRDGAKEKKQRKGYQVRAGRNGPLDPRRKTHEQVGTENGERYISEKPAETRRMAYTENDLQKGAPWNRISNNRGDRDASGFIKRNARGRPDPGKW